MVADYRLDDEMQGERHPMDSRRFRTILPTGVLISTIAIGDYYETRICRSVYGIDDGDANTRTDTIEDAETAHHTAVARAKTLPYVPTEDLAADEEPARNDTVAKLDTVYAGSRQVSVIHRHTFDWSWAPIGVGLAWAGQDPEVANLTVDDARRLIRALEAAIARTEETN